MVTPLWITIWLFMAMVFIMFMTALTRGNKK